MLPVHPNRIVFNSNIGKSYAGNPKYIYEYMVEQGMDQSYECIWFFESNGYVIPGKAKKVVFGRFKYLYYMATAKIWVFDGRQPEFLIKRKTTYYIQTWHGTPLKKLALDLEDVFMVGETDIETYRASFRKNVTTWDCLISQNKYSTETFRKAFNFRKTMLEIGYPRNDILVNQNTPEYILEKKKNMELPLDKKILLYAPTWRDDEFYAEGVYQFRPHISFEQMKHTLEQEYIVIVKYHYLIMDFIDWSAYKGFIYQFDQSQDIADLYLVSDMLITDYSSVMFDYSLLKRPMLFYAYDLNKYKDNLRGFYFDFVKEAPGPISENTEELINDILEYNAREHEKRYDSFLLKYNQLDDGKASQKIAELIKEKVKGDGGEKM